MQKWLTTLLIGIVFFYPACKAQNEEDANSGQNATKSDAKPKSTNAADQDPADNDEPTHEESSDEDNGPRLAPYMMWRLSTQKC